MKYKEFKKAVEDWGRKYNYVAEVTMGGFGIHLTVEFDGELWIISTISDVDRFELNTTWAGFSKIRIQARMELFDILVNLAKTPFKEREVEKDNLDSIIRRLKEIQTNSEDAMSWADIMSWEDFTSCIEEAYKGSWDLINNLEDIIIDLEEHKKKGKQ